MRSSATDTRVSNAVVFKQAMNFAVSDLRRFRRLFDDVVPLIVVNNLTKHNLSAPGNDDFRAFFLMRDNPLIGGLRRLKSLSFRNLTPTASPLPYAELAAGLTGEILKPADANRPDFRQIIVVLQ